MLAALLQILVAVVDTQFQAGPRTMATSAPNSPPANTTSTTTNTLPTTSASKSNLFY